MDRTIKVTGKGKVSAKPDLIRINITIKEINKEYSKTLDMVSKSTKSLKETIIRAGLDIKNLKTLSFNISSQYENYYDKDNRYRSRFIGYCYKEKLYIQFPNDNKILSRVLYELSRCEVEVEFSIVYTVKDVNKIKNSLLEKAVEDSKIKAEILSKAAGVSLGKIKNINYSWGELEIYSRPIQDFELMKSDTVESYDMDIEADDIDLEDSVTIEWEIS